MSANTDDNHGESANTGVQDELDSQLAGAPSPRTKTELKEWLNEFIDEIGRANITDDNLLEAFKDGFADWTDGDFRTVGNNLMLTLATFLKSHGVFVAPHNVTGGSQVKSLRDLFSMTEAPYWPEGTIERFSSKTIIKTFDKALQDRIELRNLHPEFHPFDLPIRTATPPITRANNARSTNNAAYNAYSSTQTQVNPVNKTGDARIIDTIERTPQTDDVNFDTGSNRSGNINFAPQNRGYRPTGSQYDGTPDQNHGVHGNAYGGKFTEEDRTRSASASIVWSPRRSTVSADQVRVIQGIAKTFPSSMKYSGVSDEMNIAFRLKQFVNYCRDHGLEEAAFHAALPILMKPGEVYDYCDRMKDTTTDWRTIVDRMEKRYETEAIVRARNTKWHTVTLKEVSLLHPEEPLSHAIRSLFNMLSKTQQALPVEFQSDATLYSRLVTAFETHPITSKFSAAATKQATSPDELYRWMYDQIFGDERSELLQRAEGLHTNTSSSYVVERSYGSKKQIPRQADKLKDPVSATLSAAVQQRAAKSTLPPLPKGKACFVCQQEGCRYAFHSIEEKKAHNMKFRNKYGPASESYWYNRIFWEGPTSTDSDDESDFEDDGAPDRFATLPIVDPAPTSESFFASFMAAAEKLNGAPVHDFNGRRQEYALMSHRPAPVEALLAQDNEAASLAPPYVGLPRYNQYRFMGFLVDTGAAERSTCGRPQFEALKKARPAVMMDTNTAGHHAVQFGIGTSVSLGTVDVELPMGFVTFHVMDADTPFLFSLADMDRLQCYLDNLRDVVVWKGKETPVVRRFGHAFITIPETML